MAYRIEIAPAATSEVRRAAAWWDEHRRDARYSIESELEAALVGLDAHPRRGLQVVTRGQPLYQLVLERTGHRLLYDVDDERHLIRIVAFWHGARRPR